MPFRTIFARNGASAGFSLARWLLVVSRAHGRERWAARVWLGLMLVLITLLDWYTDREILLATLYLCPILYATLRLSLRAGLLTLVLTTVLSAYLDFRLGRIEGGWGPATVNAFLRLLMGGVICQLVAELCAALHREAVLPNFNVAVAVSAALADEPVPGVVSAPSASRWTSGWARLAVAASVTVAVLGGVRLYNQDDAQVLEAEVTSLFDLGAA